MTLYMFFFLCLTFPLKKICEGAPHMGESLARVITHLRVLRHKADELRLPTLQLARHVLCSSFCPLRAGSSQSILR